jgi:hypothetical protein
MQAVSLTLYQVLPLIDNILQTHSLETVNLGSIFLCTSVHLALQLNHRSNTKLVYNLASGVYDDRTSTLSPMMFIVATRFICPLIL